MYFNDKITLVKLEGYPLKQHFFTCSNWTNSSKITPVSFSGQTAWRRLIRIDLQPLRRHFSQVVNFDTEIRPKDAGMNKDNKSMYLLYVHLDITQ